MVIIFSVFFKKTFKSQVNYEYFVSIVMVVIRTNKNSNKNIYKKTKLPQKNHRNVVKTLQSRNTI